MKKFWSIFTVALVALSAVSCSNNYEDVATIEGNTLSFNVNIDNTRTALEQTEKGWNTVWVGNETLVVSDGEKSYNFTNTVENKNKFSCEAVGIRSLIGKKVSVVYNSTINSAAGAAGMTLTGAAESFSETVAIDMVAGNAFLKLTSEADVTLTASADIFGDGTARQNSIVVKGADVLVPVYAAAEVTLTATIAEAKVKETVITLANNKIYNLGTIEEVKEPVQIMSAFNKVEYFAEPMMVGMPNIFMLAISDAAGNSAEFYFYNETAFLNGEYPVITMEQMGTVPAALLGGADMSNVTYGGITYSIAGGMVAIQTEMPDMDYNLVNFQLELEDANGNKAVITQGGESLISAFGYTGGSSTSPLSLKDWGFTTYEATVDGTTVTLKSTNASGEFVMVLSGVVDGNIAAADNFYVVGDNLSGYYFDALDGQFDFTEGGIWFEKMSDSNYQLFISPMYEWKIGNKWHVDNGLELGTGLDIVINFPVAEPVLSEYGVVGSFQGWDVANPIQMFVEGDWSIARSVELYKDDEIKVVKGKTWDVSYGPKDAAQVLTVDTEHTLTKGGQNIKVAKNGKFDIYFNAATAKFKYSCVEEYTNLNVTITVDNKANWSPLYIILKDGDTLLTAAEGDLVTDNKFTVSGEYIGSSLSYQFVSGDKKSDPAFVTISRGGATVTLEENVIKLYFQLDTDNAKQWWGTTSKIHVWNTGTAFDTTWPGTTMTSEGNYTWSVVVPSELVGKTINYLIHNGNNWQSKDSKLTISAEGNTVTGSSIGIN